MSLIFHSSIYKKLLLVTAAVLVLGSLYNSQLAIVKVSINWLLQESGIRIDRLAGLDVTLSSITIDEVGFYHFNNTQDTDSPALQSLHQLSINFSLFDPSLKVLT